MKAVLSNRIYMEVTKDLHNSIEKELTYTIPPRMPQDPPQVFKTIKYIRDDLISIPMGRLDLIPDDYEIVDKRVSVETSFPDFKFDLRPSQKVVYDDIQDNAIINAWVSWGKTFTGISIGNIQSLYRKMDDIKNEFGTLILDEMHHVSSPTFTRIVDEMPTRYKIGLTGTLERKDGRHVVFRDYFGNTLFRPPRENYLIPSIHIYKTDIRFLDGSFTPWAERVNDLTHNVEYVDTVALIASKYAAEGHKVLVVSDRVHLLKMCARLVGDRAVSITGDMDFDDRETTLKQLKTDEKDILFGTQSIFSEGISLDDLSCLVLGTPVNNDPLLTQLIGRVIRKKEGKKQPIIVDINLKGKTAARQASARMGFYIREGYEVKVL